MRVWCLLLSIFVTVIALWKSYLFTTTQLMLWHHHRTEVQSNRYDEVRMKIFLSKFHVLEFTKTFCFAFHHFNPQAHHKASLPTQWRWFYHKSETWAFSWQHLWFQFEWFFKSTDSAVPCLLHNFNNRKAHSLATMIRCATRLYPK